MTTPWGRSKLQKTKNIRLANGEERRVTLIHFSQIFKVLNFADVPAFFDRTKIFTHQIMARDPQMIHLTKAVTVSLMRDNVECFVEELESYMSFDLVVDPATAPTHCPTGRDMVPLISLAAYYGAHSIFMHMIQNGVNFNARDKNGIHPLHYAAMGGNISIVCEFEALGIDLMLADQTGKNITHYAAGYGRRELLAWLWANGANLESGNNSGWACIHFAARRGQYEIVEFLLNVGMNANLATRRNETPALFAIQEGNLDILSLLLRHGGANLNYDALLVCAAAKGYPDAVRLLLQAGGNPDARNAYLDTASMIAARFGHIHTLATLIAYGANLHLQNALRQDAMFLAQLHQHKEVISLLHEHGIQVN